MLSRLPSGSPCTFCLKPWRSRQGPRKLPLCQERESNPQSLSAGGLQPLGVTSLRCLGMWPFNVIAQDGTPSVTFTEGPAAQVGVEPTTVSLTGSRAAIAPLCIELCVTRPQS